MRRVDLVEKTLMLGGIGAGGEGDDRGWDGWIASLTRWTWVGEPRVLVMDRGAWRAEIHEVAKSRTPLSDWTELIWTEHIYMEFRNMVTITLYARQQKRHWWIEQSFGLCGRGRGWDDLGEWHWNMYNIICETNHQSRFDAWYRMLRAGALGWPRAMVQRGRWEGGSGWGTRVHPWRIRVDVWQNQYNIVK